MSKKKVRKQCGNVTLSPLVAVIGAIGLIFFLTLFIIAVVTKAGAVLTVIAGLFCLPCLFMVLTVNQRIDYTPEGFVYRDMLRIRHSYSYSQIKKIRYSKDVYIFVGRRIILIDSMAENGRKFARIAAQYSPKAKFITDEHSKLFGGNVANPGEFIFVYVLMGLLILGLCGIVLYELREINTGELEAVTGHISEYYFDEADEGSRRVKIKLSGCEYGFYLWVTEPDTPAYEAFLQNVREEKEFEALYLPSDKTSEGEYRIYELSCGGTLYISLDEYNSGMRNDRDTGLLLCGGLLLLWLLYVAVSSYVMCNGEKYPRLLRLFVKPEYIVNKKFRK
ncbi:MAG: hypothetical protein K2K57_01820 [Oscillospiraceae bacterium]|nr:hypothetical protein [Oscillospiraceae bacterium]